MKQSQALDIMKLGHNVFLTGEPGAGKTYTLNQFIRRCRAKGIGIGVTASTGIAATHLGGMTIHSWSGIGIHAELSAEQLSRLGARSQFAARFKRSRVLIIDEISMLDGRRLDLINLICKKLKASDKPFGGLQVILCGDLFQLPPITRAGASLDFAHLSAAWRELDLKICYLSEQHRQDEDTVMLELLRGIRRSQLGEASRLLLESRLEQANDDPNIPRLYSHNIDVDRLNAERLGAIEAAPETFTMETSGNHMFVEQLQKSCLAPEHLTLKVGAQVLCVANNPGAGFMNGTRGEVIGFEHGKPVVKLPGGRRIVMERQAWTIQDGERVLAEVRQFPLRLAWAITVHKSQGMSLDTAEIDLSQAFTPGMGYVALSRLRRLTGLYLRGINEMALQISPEISQFDVYLRQQSRSTLAGLQKIPAAKLAELHQHIATNLGSAYAEYDKDLFEALRAWRSQQASARKVPAYLVFDDKTLIALSAERPKDRAALLLVPGIGPKKLEQYADDVLALVGRHAGQLL